MMKNKKLEKLLEEGYKKVEEFGNYFVILQKGNQIIHYSIYENKIKKKYKKSGEVMGNEIN